MPQKRKARLSKPQRRKGVTAARVLKSTAIVNQTVVEPTPETCIPQQTSSPVRLEVAPSSCPSKPLMPEKLPSSHMSSVFENDDCVLWEMEDSITDDSIDLRGEGGEISDSDGEGSAHEFYVIRDRIVKYEPSSCLDDICDIYEKVNRELTEMQGSLKLETDFIKCDHDDIQFVDLHKSYSRCEVCSNDQQRLSSCHTCSQTGTL